MAAHRADANTQEGGDAPTDISVIPWCAALLSDPAFSVITTTPWTSQPGEPDSFFGGTLATKSTVAACVSQQRNPIRGKDSELPPFPAISEIRTIYLLGSGVNGHTNIAHGGFVAAVLDETLGSLSVVNRNFEKTRPRDKGQEQEHFITMTASLNVRFRKPLPTPGAILVRAWFDRVEGRKHFISGVIEDGNGVVYTEADSLFLRLRKENGSL